MTLHTGSANAKSQIATVDKDQAVLLLVTILPPGFAAIRIVNNLVDIESNGQTFTAFPLSIELSADDGETLQSVRLKVDNVTLEMITWLRSITDPIPVILQTVFSDEPDIIEQQISDLVIREVKYDALNIEATLYADDDLNQAIPSDTYNSNEFPGLF